MMKKFILIYLMAISLQSIGQEIDQQDAVLGSKYSRLTFDQVIMQLQSDHRLSVYYLPEWIEGYVPIDDTDTLRISHWLKYLEQSLDLKSTYSNNQLFLWPADAKINPTMLQWKEEIVTTSERDASSAYFGKHSYERSVKKVVIGENGISHNRKSYLTGRILNKSNGEPVIGATVVVPGTSLGAITDPEGAFVLPLAAGQSYSIQISCLGMENERYLIDMKGSGILNIELEPKMIDMKEVIVRSEEHHNVRGMQMGFQRIAMKEVKSIPVVMGERDILKVANMMPGVQTVGEGSAGFNVRGSSSDQNLFLLNGIPVLNTGHFFGFFSAFNPDMIASFNLYKGNFPVEYSGRLASVFEISSRKGNKKTFGARGSISPITGSVMLETPIVKDKSSFTLAARSTYSDWILDRLNDAELYERDASFYDIMSGVHVIGNQNDSWQAFIYHSKDRFSLSTLNHYRYENLGGSIQYDRPIFGQWNFHASAALSNYQNYQANKEVEAKAYEHEFDVREHELKFTLNGYPWVGHKVGFGGNLIWHALNQGQLTAIDESSALQSIDFGVENGLEYGLHAYDEISVTDNLTLYLGLRYSLFNYLGPKETYQYDKGAPREIDYRTDTLSHPAGKSIKHYSGPEYRASLNYTLSPNSSVKLSYNRMRQYLFMLSNTAAISPTDRWKLTDSYIAPPVADQLSLGFYQNILNSSYETSVEGYYKQTQNSIDYKDGADLTFTPDIETLVLQGEQKAYGLEFFVKKNSGRFTGWASYTWSRSVVTVNGEESWERINNGISYPANYDKPHALNLVGSYKISRRISLSSNLVYSTGRPITFPTGYYFVNGYQVVNYSLRNEYRVPDYFRVDLSLNIEGNLKKEKFAHGSWMFSVYNLTGRKNAYSVYFSNNRGSMKGYQLSIYGVPIFTITYNFKLGNYAVE